jgi:hypothetical protein
LKYIEITGVTMTDDNVAQESKRTPEWASKPFDDFIDFIENLHRVLSLQKAILKRVSLWVKD